MSQLGLLFLLQVPNVPEDNWVWSSQGAINMHLPERWVENKGGRLISAHGRISQKTSRHLLTRSFNLVKCDSSWKEMTSTRSVTQIYCITNSLI